MCSSKSATVPPRQKSATGRRSLDVPLVTMIVPCLTDHICGSPSHPEKSCPLNNEMNCGSGGGTGFVGVAWTPCAPDCDDHHHHQPPAIASSATTAAMATAAGHRRLRARFPRREDGREASARLGVAGEDGLEGGPSCT